MKTRIISLSLTLSMIISIIAVPGAGKWLKPVKAASAGDFTYTVKDDEATITGYTGSGGVVVIPDTLGGAAVTVINQRVFQDNKVLTEIIIPDSVTSIGQNAFTGCTGLTKAVTGNGLKSIPSYMFYNCSKLAEVTIGNSVEIINSYAFYSNKALTGITIPRSVTAIGTYSFSGASLESVTIPDSVTIIYSSAFSGCRNLVSVKLNNGLETIQQNSFADCTALTEIIIPDSVTTIGQNAFTGCTGLRSAVVGGGITSIPSYMFYNCRNLQMIFIPRNISAISSYSLYNHHKELEIIGYTGSFAQQYAIDNKIEFLPVDSITVKTNDITNIPVIRVSGFLQKDGLAKIYIDGTSAGEFTSNGVHKYNGTITLPDKEGRYTITAESFNDDGEKVAASCMIEYDKNAPALAKFILHHNGRNLDLNSDSSEGKVLTVVPTKPYTFEVHMNNTAQIEELYVYSEKNGNFESMQAVYDPQKDIWVASGNFGINKYVPGDLTVEMLLKDSLSSSVRIKPDRAVMFSSKSENNINAVPDSDTPEIILPKTSFAPGEAFTVTVTEITAQMLNASAFVAIYDAGAEHEAYKQYLYPNKVSENTLTFTAPYTLGDYEIRLYNRDYVYTDETFVTSVPFTVSSSTTTAVTTTTSTFTNTPTTTTAVTVPEIILSKSDFNPGERMLVTLTGVTAELYNDWAFIGLYQSGSPHDAELDFEYPDTIGTNTFTFYAPYAAGDYEMRFYRNDWEDSDDSLITRVSFTVGGTGGETTAPITTIITEITTPETTPIVTTTGELTTTSELTTTPEYTTTDELTTTVFTTITELTTTIEDTTTLETTVSTEAITTAINTTPTQTTTPEFTEKYDGNATPPPAPQPPQTKPKNAPYCIPPKKPVKPNNWVVCRPVCSNKIRYILDPSGYIYEAVPSNRLSGVKASVYHAGTPENPGMTLWESEDYEQVNPLFSDNNGRFAWDVPENFWLVKTELDGFYTAYSQWMPVPPEQLNVNIGMISKTAPTVGNFNGYPQAVEIIFNKYMDTETLTTSNITVTKSGSPVNGTIELINAEHSIDPATEYADYIDGIFATVIRFVPTIPLTVGDTVQLNINSDVKSYAGVSMAADFKQSVTIKPEPTALKVENIEMEYDETKHITVSVLPTGAGAGQKITAVSDSPFIATVNQEAVTDNNGVAQFTIKGELPGMASITFALEGTPLEAKAEVLVGMPKPPVEKCDCGLCGCDECFPPDGKCGVCELCNSPSTTSPETTTSPATTTAKPTTTATDGKPKLPSPPCDDCNLCTKISKEGYKSVKGHILGTDEPAIFDLIEVLKYLIKMDNAIDNCGNSHYAALLSPNGKSSGKPTIFCGIEILKYLIKMIDGKEW